MSASEAQEFDSITDTPSQMSSFFGGNTAFTRPASAADTSDNGTHTSDSSRSTLGPLSADDRGRLVQGAGADGACNMTAFCAESLGGRGQRRHSNEQEGGEMGHEVACGLGKEETGRRDVVGDENAASVGNAATRKPPVGVPAFMLGSIRRKWPFSG
jgi:hypothetical protein